MQQKPPRSQMVRDNDPDNAQLYSRLQVLESNAGFYLGTLWCANGFERNGITAKNTDIAPGTRDTVYGSRILMTNILNTINQNPCLKEHDYEYYIL